MKIILVTENPEKIAIAKEELQPFGIELETLAVKLNEIQADTTDEVALQKAEDAYAIIKKPLIVVDAGFFIEAFGGFPGPYTRYAETWFGADGLRRLMLNVANKNVEVRWSLAYCDGKTRKLFTSSGKGLFSTKKRGVDGNWFECLIIDPRTGLTLAEYPSKKLQTEFWGPIWSDFAKWFIGKH